MAEYSITLRSEEDYLLIKKLLKAFDGASIRPVKKKKSHIEKSLEEAAQGKVAGPFHTVDELMADLLS